MSPHSVGEQVRLSPELQGLCASAHDGSGPRPPTEAAYPACELCAAHRRNGELQITLDHYRQWLLSRLSSMSIRPHLDGHKFDPETIRVMGIAFEMALVALKLAYRGDLANEIVAQKIIALAKAGEHDPERLCDGVMREFRRPPPHL